MQGRWGFVKILNPFFMGYSFCKKGAVEREIGRSSKIDRNKWLLYNGNTFG